MKRRLGVLSFLFCLPALAGCYLPLRAAPGGSGPGQPWLTYLNNDYGFQLQFPPGSSLAVGGDDEVNSEIGLPFTPGTNLEYKYLNIQALTQTPACTPEDAPTPVFQPMTLTFGRERIRTLAITIGGEKILPAGKTDRRSIQGNFWTVGSDADSSGEHFYTYDTQRGTVCLTLVFGLAVGNALIPQTTSPPYNLAQESAIFPQIVNTFQWLGGSTVTPTMIPRYIIGPNVPLTPPFWLLPTSTPSITLTPESWWTLTPTHVHVKLVRPTPTATRRPAG